MTPGRPPVRSRSTLPAFGPAATPSRSTGSMPGTPAPATSCRSTTPGGSSSSPGRSSRPDRRPRSRGWTAREDHGARGRCRSPGRRATMHGRRRRPIPAGPATGARQSKRSRFVSVEPSQDAQPAIENLMDERRTFPPSAEFSAQANAQPPIYEEAERDYVAFWERLARERISWATPFGTTLEWDLPFARWFVGGKLNISYNCVDRHVEAGLGDKVAYHWIGEPGDTRTITYADLQREVSKAANALLELGIETGDRVAIYMPMIPELPIATRSP